jgi:hypothetical protein
MLTAEEIRQRDQRRRRILVIAGLLLLFLAAAIVGLRPTLGAIKAWQARRHAYQSFAFLDQGKWIDARNEALAAYQLRSTEPQALRAVARYLSRTRQQEALDFWRLLQARQSLTREDRRDEATIAIISGDLPRASAAVDALLANDGKDASPRDWLLAAQLALQRGAPSEAEAALQHVHGGAASLREQLLSALLELQSVGGTDQQKQSDAWQRISKLAEGKDDVSLDALMLLAQRVLSDATRGYPLPDNSSQEDKERRDQPLTNNRDQITSELAQRLASHPLSQPPQKLLALDLQLHLDPSRYEELVAKGIADWKDGEPAAMAALARWLNSKGQYQLVLDTFPLAQALQNRDLLLQHLDALGALSRWDDIRKLLEYEKYPLDPVVQQMYLARCYAQMEQKAGAENSWRRAIEAAGNDPQKLIILANYAEKNGALPVAETAYNSAASFMPRLRMAQEGRLRMAQANRDTKKIHAVLADMLRFWPNDTAVQNDEAYTRLLLMQQSQVNGYPLSVNGKENGENKEPITDNQELITIEQLAAKLVAREPASLPHRTLLALARLKQQRPAAALEVYANIQVAPNALSLSALAVHAAVLRANGHLDDAKTEEDQIKIDNLLPEEAALLPQN